MSNSENFIDEVTDDLRRDRLFAALRKYGWIGIVAVVAIVGGTAYTEYAKIAKADKAQAFGDAVLDAMDIGAPEDRRTALAAVPAQDAQRAVLELLLASDPVENRAASITALTALANDASQPQSYRDLAQLRLVVLQGKDQSLAERRMVLEAISVPGRAYRTLAQEQLAYLLVEEGKTDKALAALGRLTSDQEAPMGLRARVQQMIVALGGDVKTNVTAATGADLIAPAADAN